jgi:SpoVK/Ycf46/Vps4 family AAA+-type ATPase
LTVTVSDFLTGGDVQLEARAKAVFTVLAAQPACVVLFDEIDHFLLDRESKRYSDQLTSFQFMTPGMLTKIQDLRSSQRVIFVIATNYENRIDSAIKRTGRIDRRYLLLPPDADARAELVSKTLAEEVKAGRGGLLTTIDPVWRSRIAAASLYLGHRDIKSGVKQAVALEKHSQEKFNERLQDLLCRAQRAFSLESYVKRLDDPQDADHPHEELVCLLALAAECESGVFRSEYLVALAKISQSVSDIGEWIRAKAPGLETALVDKIIGDTSAR